MDIPNKLEGDSVGLWQIIPVGEDGFGLSGDHLENFAYQCVLALLQQGAIPIRAVAGIPGWVPEKNTWGDMKILLLKLCEIRRMA